MTNQNQHYVCVTCGTQFPASEQPPANCPICEDERQYVGQNGQQWTTLEALRPDHKNVFKEEEPNLYSFRSEPQISIGQNTHLVLSPHGNVLWDCITLLDDETLEHIQQLGGISAIAISHPHFYSSMIEWSRAFDASIYIHADEREWVMRSDVAINFWEGETLVLNKDFTLIRCGGHFSGSQVLHWANGAEGKGVLLTGDTIYVGSDRHYVSFMYSFPNRIPLPPSAIRKIKNAVEPFEFDRLYSAFDNILKENAKAGVMYSAQRYIDAITD